MKNYRSNFEPGTTRWAIRRAQWRALGIPESDMHKPKIAIINSSSEMSICFSHLDEVAGIVRQAILDAGGLPFIVKTTAPSDFITGAGRGGRYLMPARDLLVNDIEVAVEGAVLDGMVCLSSCDKTAPAHLMAAARLNIPSILVIGGYQGCGQRAGRPVDIEDVFESVGALAAGKISIQDITDMSEVAVQGPGVCAGMGTANTMHIMAEALGMALPGSAPVAARSARMKELARAAGRRIVGLVDEDLRPKDIMTPAAFANAIRVGLAVSGSINLLRHLQAIATEGEIDVDMFQLMDALGRSAQGTRAVPLLCAIKPNGPGRIEHLEAAGGAIAVMKELESLLDAEVLTVTGRTLRENLAGIEVLDAQIIGSLTRPIDPGPSVVILKGSLAPEGAVMKLGLGGKQSAFRGVCRVFESQEDAMAALSNGEITSGQVIVLRGLGARGGPGVASASWFVAAVNGAHLGDDIAVITDGQFSGLNHGFTIGQVLPEAADGGPIALVRDGDTVAIDIAGRTVDLLLDACEWQARRAALAPFVPGEKKGWLSLYQHLVQPLSKGGTLKARG